MPGRWMHAQAANSGITHINRTLAAPLVIAVLECTATGCIWRLPTATLFAWMRARDNAIDTNVLYKFAVNEKVAFVPSSVFDFTGEDCFGMRLNFTRNSPEVLCEGVRRLERAVQKYTLGTLDPG